MALNVVAFTTGRLKFADSNKFSDAVQITVDGRDLYDELEAARDPTDSDWEEGDAPGVRVELVAAPSRHWIGEPDPNYSEGSLVVVFDCGCGEWECGGYLARIDVGANDVTWSNFCGPRGGRVLPVGPFRFARDQYEEALAALGA